MPLQQAARRIAFRDRILVATVAVFDLFVGVAMLSFVDQVRVPGGHLWPWWFMASGALCLAYVVLFGSYLLLALSGSATTVAFASRATALLLAIEQNRLDISDARALVGVAEWALAAVLCGYIWRWVLRPRMPLRTRR